MVRAHHGEKAGVGPEGRGRDTIQDIGGKRSDEEIFAGYPGTVFQYPMEQMAEGTPIVLIFWKNGAQNRDQAAFFQKNQKQVGIAENGMDLSSGEEVAGLDTRIIPAYFLKRIR